MNRSIYSLANIIVLIFVLSFSNDTASLERISPQNPKSSDNGDAGIAPLRWTMQRIPYLNAEDGNKKRLLTELKSELNVTSKKVFGNLKFNDFKDNWFTRADQWARSIYRVKKEDTPSSNRHARFLSLISVVNFPALTCAGVSGNNGTCLSAQDCRNRGGTPDGVCASNFGVCCLFVVGCGSTTAQNGTYFVNNGYPNRFDGTGSCQLTVLKSHIDICQIRLDFDQFQIAGPEQINNMCNTDQFIVSGGNPIPAICGNNQGSHMYIDAGIGTTNPITLTFVTSGPSFQRNWKVKVSQIPCSTIYRAEEGCLQYYTGVSGQLKSFNYDPISGLQLSNQDYSICIRVERNFCGIQYSACPDTITSTGIQNRSRSFTLSGNSNLAVPAMIGSTNTPNSCPADWLIIPCASNVGRPPAAAPSCTDRICGGTFAAEISLQSSTVFSTVKPFRLAFHTDSVEAPNDFGNRGFCLNYVQQPCTNSLQ